MKRTEIEQIFLKVEQLEKKRDQALEEVQRADAEVAKLELQRAEAFAAGKTTTIADEKIERALSSQRVARGTAATIQTMLDGLGDELQVAREAAQAARLEDARELLNQSIDAYNKAAEAFGDACTAWDENLAAVFALDPFAKYVTESTAPAVPFFRKSLEDAVGKSFWSFRGSSYAPLLAGVHIARGLALQNLRGFVDGVKMGR
jgi:DNA repair exonuclease SbcCD ATPase subunit